MWPDICIYRVVPKSLSASAGRIGAPPLQAQPGLRISRTISRTGCTKPKLWSFCHGGQDAKNRPRTSTGKSQRFDATCNLNADCKAGSRPCREFAVGQAKCQQNIYRIPGPTRNRVYYTIEIYKLLNENDKICFSFLIVALIQKLTSTTKSSSIRPVPPERNGRGN